jgi:transposase InsO family protein
MFLLRNKSEVGDVIQTFMNQIKTQFSKIVKVVRSDNPLEFCTRQLVLFYRSLGIIHQTSCPHTSQQNGVAERKYRHVLDIARTLLIHHKVPSSYWGDAVLTACYLINRLHFNHSGADPLAGVVSWYRFIYGATQDFWLYLICSYSWSWWGQTRTCAMKCIFLGYSSTHK